MKSIRYILCTLLLIIGVTAFAQSDAGISELMKQRAQQKVAQMNDNISFMADKSKSLDTRNYYKRRALNLFIEKGEPYEEEGIPNTGVKMETTSIYRKKPSRRLMKDYFTGLVNLRYSKVDIQSTKVHEIEVSNLQKLMITNMFARPTSNKCSWAIVKDTPYIKTGLVKKLRYISLLKRQ